MRKPITVLFVALSIVAGGGVVSASGSGRDPRELESPSRASAAVSPGPRAAEGEVVVRYRAGASRDDRAAARARVRGRVERPLRLARAEVLRLPAGTSPSEAVRELEAHPDVLYAEPNWIFSIAAVPTDLNYSEQWGLENTAQFGFGTVDADIDASGAWDLKSDASSVTVAVIDTGADLGHPAFTDRIWTNPGESGDGKETNAVDDDGNGKVDDWQGWDWIDDDGDPSDGHGHGTHVAGIVGARGNDADGITGVAWNVKLMILRVLGNDGTGSLADIADAFDYAGDKGVRVVNASLGAAQSQEPQALRDAIAAHPNTLYVVAAGNDGINNDTASEPTWPCKSTLSNIVCVAATDEYDQRASFSNYGTTSVDLAAPGVDILSTVPREQAGLGSTYALVDSPGGNYVNGTDSWVSKTVDLSGQSGCSVVWDLDLVSEYYDDGVANDDWLYLQASADGTTWGTIGQAAGASPYSDGTITSSLASYEGSATAAFRFRFVTTSTITYDGAAIDNVSVVCTNGADPDTEPLPEETFETGILTGWTTGGTNNTWAVAATKGEHQYMNGTSMAAPYVAGVAALALATKPTSSMQHLKNVLRGGVNAKSGLGVAWAGRLNGYLTVKYAPDVTAPSGHKIYGSQMSLRYQKRKTFKVYWTASDTESGIRSYDVRYKRAHYKTGFSSYRLWKSATSGTSASAGSYGYTYCFDVRARDRAYNLSSYSADNCTAVPVNNTTFSHSSGWIKKSSTAGYFGNTYSYSSTKGARLKLYGVEFKRLAVVATKCNGCGKIGVYRGSKLLKTIDLQSSTYKRRRFLAVVSYSSVRGPSTITIKVLSSGKPVRIEGLGVSRV